MKTPKLVLRSTITASITYSFVTDEPAGFRSWALCTVNDATGELTITSDWGTWSHRWPASPETLGAPNLTAFIGGRSPEPYNNVDYIARKLQREGHQAYRFSANKTAASLRKMLVQRRLEDGREQNDGWWYEAEEGRPPPCDKYEADGRPIYSYRTSRAYDNGDPYASTRLPYLSKATARQIWDDLGELADEVHGTIGAEHVFWERLQHIDGFYEYVTDVPYEHAETEQTFEDRILRATVLPALITACYETALARGDVKPPEPPEAQGATA